MNNHIVENIRNRKYCDRSNCKQPLKEHIENDLSSTIYHRNDKSTKTASEQRSHEARENAKERENKLKIAKSKPKPAKG